MISVMKKTGPSVAMPCSVRVTASTTPCSSAYSVASGSSVVRPSCMIHCKNDVSPSRKMVRDARMAASSRDSASDAR